MNRKPYASPVVMKKLLLALAVLLLGCSQTSPSPTPQPDASAPDASVLGTVATPAPVATSTLCGDEPCGTVHPPAKPAVDHRSPAQIAMAACRRSDGSWACPAIKAPMLASGGPTAATCGPACTVPNWYIDPQNATGCASDSNSCTNATCGGAGIGPCLTWGQLITRFGSTSPVFPAGQSVTVSMLSPQTSLAVAGSSTDVIAFAPNLSGGGPFVITAIPAWVAAGANFPLGTVSGGFGFVDAGIAPGQVPLQIAGVPAYVTAGVVLQDANQNSYARVNSVSTGTATVTQPFTITSITSPTAALVPTPVLSNNWTTGDTIEVWTLPNLNVKFFSPTGGDGAAGGSILSSGWVVGGSIPDTSGTGASVLSPQNRGAYLVYSLDHFASRVHASSIGGRGFATYFLASTFAQAFLVSQGSAVASYGSGFMTGSSITVEGFLDIFDNCLCTAVSVDTSGQIILQTGGCYSTTNISAQTGYVEMTGSGPLFWGSGLFNMSTGAICYVHGGATFTSAVQSSAANIYELESSGAFVGTSYDGGVWTDGVSLTSSNLDTFGALQNPRTGARYTNDK